MDKNEKKAIAKKVEDALAGQLIDLIMEKNREDAVELVTNWVNVHSYAAKLAAVREMRESDDNLITILIDSTRRLQEANDAIKRLGMDTSNEAMKRITEEAGGEEGMWGDDD